MQDAWEAAKKVFYLNHYERNSILGTDNSNNGLTNIVENFTPQEVIAKFEAYEREQAEFKVGDVVDSNEYIGGVVTCTLCDNIYIMHNDGSCGEYKKSNFKKTGKHIDIQAVLQEIGGEA